MIVTRTWIRSLYICCRWPAGRLAAALAALALLAAALLIAEAAARLIVLVSGGLAR